MALIRFGDRILNTDTIASAEQGTAPRALGSNSVTTQRHILVMTTQGQRLDFYEGESGYELMSRFLSDPANVTTLG